ncbi:MAG: hypothetical protein JOZ72_07400 [Alphaproteobacteria bacterium]|nr:hypothetical protein [Alphaproteobacteria bacterium]
MRFTKLSALTVALCVGAATSALAREESAASCASAESQVATAISASQNADATKERSLGQRFCHAGYYRQGVDHYAKAMQLLGNKLAQN